MDPKFPLRLARNKGTIGESHRFIRLSGQVDKCDSDRNATAGIKADTMIKQLTSSASKMQLKGLVCMVKNTMSI